MEKQYYTFRKALAYKRNKNKNMYMYVR